MIGIIVVGHGNFASGLVSSLELISGEKEYIYTIDFDNAKSLDRLKSELTSAYSKFKIYDGILVLSDLAGGTPFNEAVKLSFEMDEMSIKVIGGVNLPALLELTMSSYEKIEDAVNIVLSSGKESIVEFKIE